jgi:hypothetical protein
MNEEDGALRADINVVLFIACIFQPYMASGEKHHCACAAHQNTALRLATSKRATMAHCAAGGGEVRL